MASAPDLDHLSNPQVTSSQLERYQTAIGDIWEEEAASRQFRQFLLTQTAGILLRLPQDVIASAIVLLQRYMVASLPEQDGHLDLDILSAAAIYLTAKLSFTPASPRSVINVYACLATSVSPLQHSQHSPLAEPPDPAAYVVSEGQYERERLRLFDHESKLLGGIGFDTHVALPHTLALMYIQTMGASTPNLAKRVVEHLNGGLLSPQLLYLTHQPNALAVAAIYLAARETGSKLVDYNWWEVFDVDREDLGFLVLAFGSVDPFARAEEDKWGKNREIVERQ